MGKKYSTHYFVSSDRPISSIDDDLLNRGDFSKHLAKTINGWRGKDSLVLALYGTWGSGKTSLKNLIKESLNESKDDCPIIMEYNPWEWSGQNKLEEAFFQEMEIAIKSPKNGKTINKLIKKLREYSSYLYLGSHLFVGIKKLITVLLIIIGVMGLSNYFIEFPIVNITFVTISIISLLMVGALNWSGQLLNILSSTVELKREKSIQKIKDDLIRLINDIGKSILIIIDDIDRLDPSQIRRIFQLIKANANFPNLIYLLLFQRDIIEKSLKNDSQSGSDYLDKIVQVGFDIPKIERSRLEKVLFSYLNNIIENHNLSKNFDQRRWDNIYITGLRGYFDTLRHVYRFIATFSFQVDSFKSNESFEVNFVDLASLEVLRVFEPNVYHQITVLKDSLTRGVDQNLGTTRQRDKIKGEIEGLVALASDGKQNYVQPIIKALFPKTEWVFGGPNYSSISDTWFTDLRVCHPDRFDKYFILTIPEKDISQAEIDYIISLTGDRYKLTEYLSKLSKQDIIDVVFDRLEYYKTDVKKENAVPFITALFDYGDKLSDEFQEPPSLNSVSNATRIIYFALKENFDQDERGRILQEAIEDTIGMFLPIRVLSWIEDELEKEPEKALVTEYEFQTLRQKCLEKIRVKSKSDELIKSKHLFWILHSWKDWSEIDEVRKWATRIVKTRDGVLVILSTFLHVSRSQPVGDYSYRKHYSMVLKNIEEFVSLDEIKKAVKKIEVDSLEGEQALAVRTFYRALERREEGKPDDDWHDEEWRN